MSIELECSRWSWRTGFGDFGKAVNSPADLVFAVRLKLVARRRVDTIPEWVGEDILRDRQQPMVRVDVNESAVLIRLTMRLDCHK